MNCESDKFFIPFLEVDSIDSMMSNDEGCDPGKPQLFEIYLFILLQITKRFDLFRKDR